MNIAILVSEFDGFGGTETQTRLLAEKLSKKHSVTVITRRARGLPKTEARKGFSIRRLFYVRIPLVGFILFSLSAFLYLLRKRRNIDVLQCMMINPNGLIGLAAEKLLGIRTFVWSRGEYSYITSWFFSRLVVNLVINRARNIIVQSNAARKQILEAFPGKTIHVIPNGIDIPSRASSGSKVVYVGRLTPVKGVSYLLDALSMMKSQPETIIVGDGAIRKELERRARGLSVVFAGSVPPEEVSRYLLQARVLVLPSLSEGFPNAVLEAMSFGVPVIATAVGSVPEIVKHGENGFLVKPKDPKSIAAFLEKLLSDDILIENMRRNARLTAGKYSWSAVIKKLEALYNA